MEGGDGADNDCTLSGHVFLLVTCGRIRMRFAFWRYPLRGQTIKFGGSVEPDLGKPQVACTDSAVVRFACPLEAFVGHGPILGGRFHFGEASQSPFYFQEMYISRVTTESYPLVYAK
jgi:hypothetical protein